MAEPAGNGTVLKMTHIKKVYPGVQALKDCALTLNQGEVLALVGENGAGKSTLMRVLTGIEQRDGGDIYYKGSNVFFKSPRESQEAGIAMVHQELNLMNHLTVAQNIFIGREGKGLFISDRFINKKSEELIRELKIKIDPTEIIGNLTVGKQQMVEIARAISFDAGVIIFDEPSAALTDREVEELFAIMRQLREKGVSMIYISHRMDEIYQIADRVAIMRDGESVGEFRTDEIDMDGIISRMVGRTIYEKPKTKSLVPADAPVILRAKGLRSPVVKDVSFDLRKGEILGFAGLIGAGRTEVARLIFGADPMYAGEIEIHGQKKTIKKPIDAVKAGIGYLSEDRRRYGLAVGLPITDNSVLACLERYQTGPLLNQAKIDKDTETFSAKINIKAPSIRALVKKLSGGNQQKVIIAKWLIRDSEILIFDEPTRGIDVGAKSEIYKIINQLAAQGKAIIMISSELPEILRMSDRVAVMCEGKLTKMLPIEECSQETIMKYATMRN